MNCNPDDLGYLETLGKRERRARVGGARPPPLAGDRPLDLEDRFGVGTELDRQRRLSQNM